MLEQGHLGIYYYVETRSYGMFGPRAPTFPVLDCRSAGKLTSRGPSTTPMAPPGRSQDSGRWTGHRIIAAMRECNFPRWWRFKFLPPFSPKLIKRWLTTDHLASNAREGRGAAAFGLRLGDRDSEAGSRENVKGRPRV